MAAILLLAFVVVARPGAAQDARRTPVVIAVQRVAPAVVNISSEQRTNPYAAEDPFFNHFFQDFFGPQREENRSSLGSGVIIDERGYVLTNEHVILKGSKIAVTLADKREFAARVVGADSDSDLAVLKVDGASSLPAVKMGTSSDLMIGESVIAIGNPFGLSHTVTTGIISALSRSIRTEDQVLHDFIQTDASINPGNSGGPLLNINGELIGVNTAIYQNAQGIGFAIPIDRAKQIVSDLLTYGSVRKAYLGMQVDVAGQPSGDDRPVQIIDVLSGSPAESAGLHAGDLVIAINGVAVRSLDDYDAQTSKINIGDRFTVEVERRGVRVTTTLLAADFTAEVAKALCRNYFGLTVEETKTGVSRRSQGESGMIITDVEPRSRAARLGIRRGIVVREINGLQIDSIREFTVAMSRVRRWQAALFMIDLNGQYYRVRLFAGE